MSALSRFLTDADAVVFIVLALASVREYRRGRAPAPAWAAGAFVTLGAVAAIGLVPLPMGAPVYQRLWWQVLVRVLLGVIVSVPYLLYRVAASFRRPSPALHRTLTAMTAAVVVAGFALPRIPGPGQRRPAWVVVYAGAILAQWTATSAYAAVWIWRAGRGRPTAARNRMRLLAAGCAAFNVVLLFSATRPQSGVEPNHLVQLLDLVVAGLFYLGLAPPHALVERWRRPEQAAIRAAFSDLVGAMTAREVGAKLLPHLVAYVGADGAALYDRDGQTTASYGNVGRTGGDDVLRFPLRSGGALEVQSTTYSPLFAGDKVSVLQSIADWTDMALDRCAVIARERQFISNAAHELRTPLTSLFGFAAVLAEHRRDMTEQQIDTSLEAMVRQGDRARRLMDNLLDMAQIERGTLRFSSEVVALADVVDDSIESAPAPSGRHIEIHVPPGVRVRTDPARLRQVIVNLVTNAYRYGGPSISVDARTSGHGGVVLTISDDGAGVPSDLVPHLFEPFARDVASNGSGSGLGLAISRQITNALGGSIRYEQDAPGARFVVTLPEAA
jgi:signal transduction histidine kinase